MSPIAVEDDGRVAVLRMRCGPANLLDETVCRELAARVDGLSAGGHRAVVLTGRPEVFSAGFDLRRLRAGGAPYVRRFLPALSDALLALFGFPGPVVAAVSGDALSGGAVLAAACDRRVMSAECGRFGLTDLAAGLPFPLVAMEILRCAYGSRRLPELVLAGGPCAGPAALALGLVDGLAADTEVLPRSVEIATRLAAVPPRAFAHTKAQLHRPFDERIGEHRAADDAYVEMLWAAPETHAAIDAHLRRAGEPG
ncbi:enoyl-CoA hydratase/isomerase family protein [Amycolatopsis rhizosphaerae]|uniref:Enoyl-CoA hydratase/isomerase family protein n=1 Tax=Amycolatopsis rhizosphaerae TaxID=2053003 RepID=A0A558DEB5_9PSEU|nr:enoyl-CoA hydratase/isomerase family protein [Amycolatopsis rhizosphaerae]TVT59364.1 enoyl-CoA hydratase/isomerase family protein [Amycolatopsis rhizosphaerae]